MKNKITMKLTKGNVSRVLVKGGVARSVIIRGRIRGLGDMTEGFTYIKESSNSLVLDYQNFTGSRRSESFFERRAENIQKMVALLLEKGFKAEVTENNYVRVTL
jgi:hypothetical protein